MDDDLYEVEAEVSSNGRTSGVSWPTFAPSPIYAVLAIAKIAFRAGLFIVKILFIRKIDDE